MRQNVPVGTKPFSQQRELMNEICPKLLFNFTLHTVDVAVNISDDSDPLRAHIDRATRLIQGDFFHWSPPKKLEYGKPRIGESTLP